MPTYDGIGSSITHEIEVVGDVFISNVEGGSLSTQVPFEIGLIKHQKFVRLGWITDRL